ncbi:hypothetical protein [Jannaschia faecimaris]|uniref:hypothetical protein n=1 Tax=Jannaschia faecimaris TaxID=1244108 RepID=UPI000B83CEB9|nr:hypothetical protein [Jannaschia faecimaris]
MIRSVAVLGVAVLTACQPGATARTATLVGQPGLSLAPAPGGLIVVGSGGREIGFGRDQKGALESVARVEEAAPQPTVCGNGRDGFLTKSGLRLVFEDGRFVGWEGAPGRAGRRCA